MLCLALAGCGGGSDSVSPPIQTPPPAAPPVVTPPPPPASASAKARFAYAANAEDGTISIYAVDSQSGQLRANGYVHAGFGVRAVAVDPTNAFAYALVQAGVFAARINAETGALAPLAGNPYATDTTPLAFAVDPTGRYVYVVNNDSEISAHSIDPASGSLAAVAGGALPVGDAPESVSVDPSGKFVYVANQDSNSISAFRIDSASGALAPIAGSPFASGIEPSSITINKSGTFAFVTNRGAMIGTGTISVFSIDAASGVLTLTASPAVANGSFPEGITTNPASTFLYVANGGSNNVSAYAIGGNGALTEVAGSPYATGRGALAVIVDPSGSFVYVATGRTDSNDIAAFSIDPANGALSPLAATPFIAARGWPRSLAIAAGASAVEFKSQFVYTANFQSNNLSAYAIDAATGALTTIPGAPFAAGTNPIAVAIDPLNRYVYAANFISGDISAFTIEGATGALTPIAGSPFAAAALGVNSIAIDPSGRFVYVTGGCVCVIGTHGVAAYAIDATTGALTQVAGSPYEVELDTGEAGPSQNGLITVDPRGKIVYVSDSNADNIAALEINPATGALTPVPGSPFEAQQEGVPTSISIHPAGRFAYVALGGLFQNLIYKIDSTFTVDPATFIVRVVTGAPEFFAGTPFVLNSFSSSLAVDATGRFAYALDPIDNNIRGYSVNGQTGQLTAFAGTPFATGGAGGLRLTTDVSGKFVYVANFTSNNISAFTINTADGSLVAIPGSPFAAGGNPRSIAVSGRVQ